MRLFWASLPLAMLALACSDDDDDDDANDPPDPPAVATKLEGRLDVATFAAPPTAVDAIDEASTRISAPLAPDGAFTLELAKRHSYKLVVVLPGGEVPIVFPRPDSRLDRTFHVASGNALVTLGTIRHFAARPATGVTAEEVLQTSCAPGVVLEAPDDDDDDDDGDEPKRAAPVEEDADPAAPFAVPDRNAPNEVKGCED